MPTYQYACTECGGQLEAVQKFTDDALTVHEECGGRLRKVFSPAAIVFKGSGFYRNDSRGNASSAAKPGSDSAGSESKPGDNPATEKAGGEKKSDAGASSSSDSKASSSSSGSSGEKVA